ncbi:MAG TPA: CinA family nicotinamide mononucleotide deamidase-related protein [Thermomicrobiales bacterium]|nr:CinA family nicotinamide mononucleotide deamidase-related protein [Thermomicrobiales bacterium]
MRAYILSVGSELMLGHLVDTNAPYLAQELASLGIELLRVIQVGDDRNAIADTIANAAEHADLVVCTGGVGPTEDDLTREAIADVVGETPVVDPELLATVESIFAGRGLAMPERNKKQAWLIPSAEALPNPVGTAPGWLVRDNGAIIISMPGVPREMKRMWREQVVPRLQADLPERVVRSVTIKTIGIGESAAEEQLDDLVHRPNPVVATYAKEDGVHVRVTAVAATVADADRLKDETAADIRNRLHAFVYGEDETTLSESLIRQVGKVAGDLAVIDEGGGGRFAALIASSPSAGSVLNLAELRPRGNAGAMDLAQEAARTAHLGIGIVVNGTAGDQERSDTTVDVAIAGRASALESFPLHATFGDVQRRSALIAADVLHRALAGPFRPD